MEIYQSAGFFNPTAEVALVYTEAAVKMKVTSPEKPECPQEIIQERDCDCDCAQCDRGSHCGRGSCHWY